ncbi:MAG TPA: RDD family protein [Solirubrobacterales bacterium]
MADPQPQPSIPARIIGSGARRVGRVAGATGLDTALEEAIADAVVRTVESPAFERALTEVLEGPTVERAVGQAMRSEAVERALTEAIDSEMIDRVWERLLASDEAQKLVERIAEAPEVRAAIAQQGVGLLSDLGRHIGEVARKADDILERFARRITFARPRTEPTDRAGAVTRLLALLVDAGILNLAVIGTGAVISFLIDSVFGAGTHREAPIVALGIGSWVFLAGLYLTTFWRFEGETPGMRFIGLNLEVDGVDEKQLGTRKALGRLFWLLFSFVPLLGLPLLGVARRDDRTGLHDRRTGTTIVYKDAESRLAPWTIQGRAKMGSAARPAARPGEQGGGDARSV